MNERDKELGLQAGYQSVVLLDAYGSDGLSDWELDDLNSLQKFADLVRADEREDILNLVQKMAARFYNYDAEKAFEELTEAIRARGNT